MMKKAYSGSCLMLKNAYSGSPFNAEKSPLQFPHPGDHTGLLHAVPIIESI